MLWASLYDLAMKEMVSCSEAKKMVRGRSSVSRSTIEPGSRIVIIISMNSAGMALTYLTPR